MPRPAALMVLLVALVCAPVRGEDAGSVAVSKKAEEALAAAVPLLDDAQRDFAAKDWDGSVASYAKALAALGDDPVLGGWRDQANYNTACALARSGKTGPAADAFAASIHDGLRPVVVRGAAGGWVHQPGLTLEHVLADADVDTIRTEAAYVGALKSYLAAGEPVIEFTKPETSSLVPAVIVLAAEGEDAARALPPWRVAAKERRVALVALAGPVRPSATERHWILRDGDERWAVAKVRETLDAVAKDVHVDPKRIYLAGVGERPGEAAWAAALADPARFAGVAAVGARFHAAWHADAIAAAPKEWRVAVGAADAEPLKMLKERGIEAARVEASNDESKIAAAVLAALLDAR